MSYSSTWCIAICLACSMVSAVSVGQEQPPDAAKPPDDAKRLASQWIEQREREFKEYELTREAAQPAPLTMESGSVLNWSNPERGTGQGPLYIWTDRGRPQMLACAFEWKGILKHEFHSLSTDAIAAERGGKKIHRFGSGIEWQPLAGAPKPAMQRALRLTQLRRQAERFRVTVGSKQANSETRLLPQPIFRSAADLAEDIAVFVFVQGTDPECTLLVEVTPEKDWRYALARQTKWGLSAELDGKPVWEQRPKNAPQSDPQTPFLVLVQKPDAPAP